MSPFFYLLLKFASPTNPEYMKRKIILLWVCSLVIFRISAQGLSSAEAFDRIRANYIQAIVGQDQAKMSYLKLLSLIPAEKEVSDQNIVELYQRFPVEAAEMQRLVRTMKEDGSWPDINYKDKKRSGWEPKKHAERILSLAKFYYSGEKSDSLKETIRRAMDFWFRRDFTCLNWWYNQIGIPRTLGPAFLLFEPEMSGEEKQLAIREMEHSRFGMTGQNKVWLAGNVLIRGLLQEDMDLVRAARDTIVSEIVLGKKEGIKRDWSFHQHGPQQQFGNYGLSFLSNMCMYAEVFAHTPLALPEEQMDILFSFFQEGYRWIVWKGYWDVNGLNRQLFHNADIHKSFTLLFAANSMLQGCSPRQAKEIRQFIRENFTAPRQGTSWTGNKVFWESDQTVHRTPQWMASVKMASQRVIGTELVNEDNKLGYYLADGALYTYVKGDEYHNVFPFWDWRKIPGITCIETQAPVPVRSGAGSRNKSNFVGGVSDGRTGITAMELRRGGLTANKCWVFTDRFVICLGSGIEAAGRPSATAVEQLAKNGSLLAAEAGRWTDIQSASSDIGRERRFYHANTGYILLKGDSCRAACVNREGQWYDVMGMYKPVTLQREMVSLYIKHTPDKVAEYTYLVLPAMSPKDVLKFDTRSFTVTANRKEVQAVYWNKTHYIAAYAPCEVELPDKETLKINTPGLYLIQKHKKQTIIRAVDPTRKLSELELCIRQKTLKLSTDESGGAEASF